MHTVNVLLVLVKAVIRQVEFTVRSLGGAIAVWKVVDDDLDDLLPAGEDLGCISLSDERPDVDDLWSMGKCVSSYAIGFASKAPTSADLEIQTKVPTFWTVLALAAFKKSPCLANLEMVSSNFLA